MHIKEQSHQSIKKPKKLIRVQMYARCPRYGYFYRCVKIDGKEKHFLPFYRARRTYMGDKNEYN